jgi:thiamine kinase-like enzyme
MLSTPRDNDVIIDDSFGIRADPTLPTAEAALEPRFVSGELSQIPFFTNAEAPYTLVSIRVLRHKPNKRCLLEYRFEGNTGGEVMVLLGKIRAKRSGKKQYRLQSEIWLEGFDETSVDGISVPKPLAHIASLNMWLQPKVKGEALTALLNRKESLALMPRIAEAAYKIHNTGFDVARTHTIDDEVSILKQRLTEFCRSKPEMEARVNSLLHRAVSLAATVPEAPNRNIHRDYYPDQIIVSPDRKHITVIDFDLCCKGDPALDIGNFIGHLIEHAIRYSGNPEALSQHCESLTASYLRYDKNTNLYRIQVYTFLTLIRHISISFQMPSRNKYTRAILEACDAISTEYFS